MSDRRNGYRSSRRRSVRIAVAGVCALAGAAGCARTQSAAPPPNVVLIVVDTLRADRLGSYGNPRGLTPVLDAFATRGTRFANAYATSSWTSPSVASLFTSRYPSQNGVTTFDSQLPDEELTLAEALAPMQYDAKGMSGNLHIRSQLGYGQGFADFETFLGPADKSRLKSRADFLAAQSLAWLSSRQAAGDSRPFFLYLQYMEPHVPYRPPEPFRSRFIRGTGDPLVATAKQLSMRYAELSDGEVELLESLYDGEVASLDAGLKDLFEGIERLGLGRDTIFIVTADHGEEFREHGLLGHGNALFEESVRIPLVVAGPGVAAGRTVSEPVRLIDIAPTLLEMVGLPPEARFEGRSLLPLMRVAAWRHPFTWLQAAWARRTAAPDVYCELENYDNVIDLRRHSEALIRPPTKLVVARIPPRLASSLPAGIDTGPDGSLTYDLAADPQELHPQPAAQSAAGRDLDRSRHAIRVVAAAHRAPLHQPVDDATKEKLRALGYAVKP